jgi:thioredoxin 1
MKTNIIASLAALLALTLTGFAEEKSDHGAVVTVDSKNWEAEVVKSDKPVLVDFWAPWCGPCVKLGPHVVALSKEDKNVKYVKVNIDENEALAKQFGIQAIPYLAVLKGGKKVDDTKGYMEKDALKKFVDAAAAKAK